MNKYYFSVVQQIRAKVNAAFNDLKVPQDSYKAVQKISSIMDELSYSGWTAMQKETCDLINQLVDLKMRMIDSNLMGGFKHNLSCLNYDKEFLTVRFDNGRQTGKTTAVLELAKKYNVTIVTPTYTIADMYRVRCKQSGVTARVHALGGTKEWFVGQEYADIVVVDCASLVAPEKLDDVYKNLLTKMYLLLG
jgi:hypothetical protein